MARRTRLRMSEPKGHSHQYDSSAVLDLTFAMTTRGHAVANVKSTAPGRRSDMREPGKILVVSQHYPPDTTTTATYVGRIAQALAAHRHVVVLSGSPQSASDNSANPVVIEIIAPLAPKHSLARRTVAIV